MVLPRADSIVSATLKASPLLSMLLDNPNLYSKTTPTETEDGLPRARSPRPAAVEKVQGAKKVVGGSLAARRLGLIAYRQARVKMIKIVSGDEQQNPWYASA